MMNGKKNNIIGRDTFYYSPTPQTSFVLLILATTFPVLGYEDFPLLSHKEVRHEHRDVCTL